MNKEIRVLICDDSATMRTVITTAIEGLSPIKVVGKGKHGGEAVQLMVEKRPDVVVLDVEMPVMDGIDAARAIRAISPNVPIIMFSSLTKNGAEATLDALQTGATDFATKPTGMGDIEAATNQVRQELGQKILHYGRGPEGECRSVQPRKSPSNGVNSGQTNRPTATRPLNVATKPTSEPVATNASGPASAARAVAIGVSTGGPEALVKVLAGMPKPFNVPVLIAQHMPPTFTGLLAKRLTAQTGHTVREAVHDQEIKPGEIWLAPGDYHLTIQRSATSIRTQLDQSPPENSCRPAVDPLFRSMASCFGRQALGVVLTGMGKDGTKGAKEIKAAGGQMFVQNEESCLVYGMPREVIEAGYADQILCVEEMGRHIAAASKSAKNNALKQVGV